MSFRSVESAWTRERIVGGVFGTATQLLFLYTVFYLFQFLRYGSSTTSERWLAIDLVLAVSFAFPHSMLLAPSVQKRMKAAIPGELLGCVHCIATCISLLVLFHFWGRSGSALWRLTGVPETIMLVGFYGSWCTLLYSICLTGFGYQTGFTQWRYWIQNKPAPKREFVVRGTYRWLRHPVYMSFLGLIWFTPTMTLDHAVLTVVWTIYIYTGSYFKDLRMSRYIGQAYRDYAAQVPGLPIIGFGPLLKMKVPKRILSAVGK